MELKLLKQLHNPIKIVWRNTGRCSYDQHCDWRLIGERIKKIQTKLVCNLPNAMREFQRERGQMDDREMRRRNRLESREKGRKEEN